jgi:predicted nuclease of predicted toxin-antitoxin system
MITFYTDSHIAKTIVMQLRHRDVDVIRCQDVGMGDADDVTHLKYATSQGRTVITSDEDFLALDAQWQSSGKFHAGIIYVPPQRKDAIGIIVAQLVFCMTRLQQELLILRQTCTIASSVSRGEGHDDIGH